MFDFLTIGHSNRSSADFISCLREYRIQAVADVRTVPASGHYPDFNRSRLASLLRAEGVSYAFFGHALGGRPASSVLYKPNGRADYEAMASDPGFVAGIEQLRCAPALPVALMCSEGNPRDCHRSLLVSRSLAARGVLIAHIERDGATTTHEGLERQLLSMARLDSELFRSDEEVMNEAYARQADGIAYMRSDIEESRPA